MQQPAQHTHRTDSTHRDQHAPAAVAAEAVAGLQLCLPLTEWGECCAAQVINDNLLASSDGCTAAHDHALSQGVVHSIGAADMTHVMGAGRQQQGTQGA